MIISDLSHLDLMSEDDAILGSAGALIGSSAIASGDYNKSKAKTKAFAIELPNGGSLALAFGYANAKAYGDDASADTDVFGDADGDIEIVKGRSYSVNTPRGAYAGSVGLAIAFDLPG
ncbi:hypothetical protein WA1_40100 [Scytonema hofmannii PCC 7110]|uniref:Uncharacterized protein n=1 Tax=Scytonema hofmannii PCC 7110 TaxID=128403 RepID=A0A139WZ36_9CYAN|nr:hypothetical protein [Scytonema hofmannii]KYC37666.1 hypothetical protein WA1_40100 [Scytonema hofmannii PCC 7110]